MRLEAVAIVCFGPPQPIETAPETPVKQVKQSEPDKSPAECFTVSTSGIETVKQPPTFATVHKLGDNLAGCGFGTVSIQAGGIARVPARSGS